MFSGPALVYIEFRFNKHQLTRLGTTPPKVLKKTLLGKHEKYLPQYQKLLRQSQAESYLLHGPQNIIKINICLIKGSLLFRTLSHHLRRILIYSSLGMQT